MHAAAGVHVCVSKGEASITLETSCSFPRENFSSTTRCAHNMCVCVCILRKSIAPYAREIFKLFSGFSSSRLRGERISDLWKLSSWRRAHVGLLAGVITPRSAMWLRGNAATVQARLPGFLALFSLWRVYRRSTHFFFLPPRGLSPRSGKDRDNGIEH